MPLPGHAPRPGEIRRKILGVLGVAAALAIIAIPSSDILRALRASRRLISGFEPATLRSVRVRFVDPSGSAGVPAKSRLRFVNFALKSPEASKVSLIGEFNGWGSAELPLARQSRSRWEITVPLPQGRHYYLFVVDGKPETDPRNPDTASYAGRIASVIDVR
jgi:hypothetical protein